MTHREAMKKQPVASSVWAYDSLLDACLENDLKSLAEVIDRENINAPVLDGLLPLQVAATAGHEDAVRALVRHGARVNATDNASAGKNAALHFAVLARRLHAVRALLELGADPNALNCVKTTPMHDAARVGDVDIAESLKAKGADLMLENSYGNTVLHRACLHGNQDMVLWVLRSLRVSSRATMLAHRNHAGYNVQDVAISRSAHSMVRLLESLGAQCSHPHSQLLSKPYSELKAWKAFLGGTQVDSRVAKKIAPTPNAN